MRVQIQQIVSRPSSWFNDSSRQAVYQTLEAGALVGLARPLLGKFLGKFSGKSGDPSRALLWGNATTLPIISPLNWFESNRAYQIR